MIGSSSNRISCRSRSPSSRNYGHLIGAASVCQITSRARSPLSIGDEQSPLPVGHYSADRHLRNLASRTSRTKTAYPKIVPIPNTRSATSVLDDKVILGLHEIAVGVYVYWVNGVGCSGASPRRTVGNKLCTDIIVRGTVSCPSRSPDSLDYIRLSSNNICGFYYWEYSLNFVCS